LNLVAMDELENPYRPGAGFRPPALTGRDPLIDRAGVLLRRALARRPGKGLVPLGLRGVGKTVLLNRFVEIAQQEGMIAVVCESTEGSDFIDQFTARLRAALFDLEGRGTSAKVAAALRVLKGFALTHHVGDSAVTLELQPLRGRADSGRLDADLSDVLVAAGEAAASRSTGLVVAIDEVQYLRLEQLAAVLSALHRTNQLDLPVAFFGAGLPHVPALAGRARTYAERLFEFPALGGLAPADARAAVEWPAEALGARWARTATERVVQRTRGYPYFLQEWAYAVWNAATRVPVSAHVVDQVEPLVLDSLDRNFFAVRYDRITPGEQRYLQAMGRLGPGPHASGAIAAELGVGSQTVAPRRASLIAKGMLFSPAYGMTAFTVPLFDEFLHRRAEGKGPRG
jgi:hypothetical protein